MLAISTVAMSAYNIMAMSPQRTTLVDLYETICQAHGIEIPKNDFIEAIKGLSKRKYIEFYRVDGGRDEFQCVDRGGRRVRWRDRTGDGWDNWNVESPQGPIPLNHIVGRS